jgi:tetratricopeptide (TPR) repeat protein
MKHAAVKLCLSILFMTLAANGAAIAQDHEQALQSLVAEAGAAQARGDFASAAEAYRNATSIEPGIAELWANLGLMDHEIGKSTEAIESFKHAVRLKPDLYVPQLFLGIEYLQAQKPDAALPFLETATKLNPKDPQAEIYLGKAYALTNHIGLAANAFQKGIELAPNDGDAWLGLGAAYLQQVDNDARLMTSTYSKSPYVELRAAETDAEQGKLADAENAYRVAIAPASPAPCAHAEFGITLLREKKAVEAREQFEAESRAGSHCGLTRLGDAVADAADGHWDAALKALVSIAADDPGFVRSNLHLFRDALSADQAKSLAALAREQQNAGSLSFDLGSLIEQSFLFNEASSATGIDEAGASQTAQERAPADADALDAAGKYAACDQTLKPELQSLNSAKLQLLASCSFYTGDFLTTSKGADRLKALPATLIHGLYWETKADEELAVAALTRAGEIDPNSTRMHVLIGDVFRQKRRWSDAEAEYRKALSIDPKSRGARLSLAIVLFTELKTNESFEIAKALLAEAPDDPETNLLMGEILVQRNQFAEAEPYLSRCQKLDPDLVPRWHILLGQVYAATNRIPEAISEYKLGLTGDLDGSIHYQLARLYQKAGNRSAAEEEIRISKELRERWDNEAHVALEQLSTDTSRQ